MGTSEVHLPEGENLIDFSQRGASLLFSFFLHDYLPFGISRQMNISSED